MKGSTFGLPKTLLCALIVAMIVLVTSCAGAPSGAGRGAPGAGDGPLEERAREVLDAWKAAVKVQDIDRYMSLHWDDALKLNGEPNGVLHILRGTGEIRGEMGPLFIELADFLSQHEYPPVTYTFDEATGTAEFVFGLENPQYKEGLRLEEREGMVKISEHWAFGRFFGDVEAGELTAWADEEGNGDGLLQPHEQERLFIAAYPVLFEQHEVDNPMDEFFDWDNDGYIDELDNEIAQQVLLRNRFRRIDRFDEELARHRLPPADKPYVNIHDANWIKHAVVHPEWELPIGPVEWENPRMVDFNEDDLISPMEIEFFRDIMMRVAAVNPGPVLYDKEMPAFTSEIRRWLDQNGDGQVGEDEMNQGGFELFELLHGEHGIPAWTPIVRFFDRNRDRDVEKMEKEWAIDFAMDLLLPTAAAEGISVWSWEKDRMVPFEFDTDGRGGLSDGEIEDARRFLVTFDREFWENEEGQPQDPNATDQRWIDVDGNGEVEMWEADLRRDLLCQGLLTVWLRMSEEEANSLRVRSALDAVADVDGDGMLSTEEREELIWGLAHPHESRTVFDNEIDFDGNGELSMDEILRAKDTGYIPSGEVSSERRIASLGSQREETPRSGAAAAGGKSSTGAAAPKTRSKVKAVATWGSSLAVLGVWDMTEKMPEGQTKLLVSFLENAFVNYGNVTVVDRQNLEKIMEEYKYQTSALVDEETAVEIGKLSGADAIAIGNLSSLSDTYYLHLKVINVQSGAIIGSSISEGASEKDFLGMCNGAVEPLF